ncbi:alpha/beta hydrolase [Actinopolyspora erythraea]|uniref:Alpha/beta hydrolase n=1 Tax=Actinopolyspora erythraea TaxID=414996 RepID=A0A099D1Y8_9ACTN|nr:alpha/beta hydrolase [Actinopolyspora erythraea]ASU77794.1 alpha/beta hydrolase [Actinopolyspora erythraea]KGI80009.1 alpha/beta hydrolase [Actinopolyspora erythraea]
MTAPSSVVTEHVEFPAGTIRYHRAGSAGPAVVLLHGGGIDNAMISWRHAIPALAVDHRVFLPDLPRHGGSGNWTGNAGQRTLEEVLRWLLDLWGLDRAVLVGLSTGGSVVTGFTLRHPQRVNGLVLAAPDGLRHRIAGQLPTYLMLRSRFSGPAIAALAGMSRGLCRQYLNRGVLHEPGRMADTEQLLDEVLAEARESGSVFSDWQFEAVGSRNMRVNHLPYLDRIRCPTMFVHGEFDRQVPVEVSRTAARAVAGSELRVLTEAGHWCQREKPDEFNAALREFLNSNGSG